MRHRIHQQILYLSCIALAFFLALAPRLLPLVIMVMGINWLVSGIWLKTIPRLCSEKWRIQTLLFAALYLLYLAGMLYSTDFNYGWFDLQVKLSLLIFPLIFSTSDLTVFTASRIRLLFGAFIAGIIAGSVMLLFHTLVVNVRWGVPDPWYYTSLAWFFHPTYLAMYYCFGMAILLLYIGSDASKNSFILTLLLCLCALYLEILIFLLSSKAGVMVLALVQILFLLLLLHKKTPLYRVVYIFMFLAIVFVVNSRMFPKGFSRFSTADKMISDSRTLATNPEDGTVARMEIWKISADLIRQHFLFGVGTGDVKDVLMESYREHQLYPVYKKKLNAHNQYIQTFLTLGVTGFLLLLAILFKPAWHHLRKGNFLYVAFIVIFAVNLLFESMLEIQAGVVFYAFFNALIFSTAFVEKPLES